MSEEQQEEVKTYTQAEVDELVSGLKSNNEKLLSEKKATQAREAEAAEAARIAQEEAATKNGDVESLQNYHAEALGKKDNVIAELQSAITSGTKDAYVNDFVSLFKEDSQALAKSWIQDKLVAEYNDGKISAKFLDVTGGLVSTDAGAYKEYLKGVDILKPHLKGIQMNGGGAAGSQTNGGGAAKTFNDYTPAELVALKRSDPESYAKLKTK